MTPTDAGNSNKNSETGAGSSLWKIDELHVGMTFKDAQVFDAQAVENFCGVSNDFAPLHTDEVFAKTLGHDRLVVHGFYVSSVFSRILGMKLPGGNSVIKTLKLDFRNPVYVGDEVFYSVSISSISPAVGVVSLDLRASDASEKKLVTGQAQCVMCYTAKY
jgi:3-hydroxybutyryl-CoA dehydratase